MARPASLLVGGILLASMLVGCAPASRQPAPSGNESVAGLVPCQPQVPCPVCAVCTPPKPVPTEATYREVGWPDIPAWSTTALLPSLRAFIASCERVATKSPWQAACADARAAKRDDERTARDFFERHFSAYRIVAPDGREEGLITGYYEPILKGRRQADAAYRFPVYATPNDLIVVDLAAVHPELAHLRLRGRLEGRRLVPYYPRSEIDGGSAAIPARPLAWVADAVDLFFLQIQGSGQIELPSGERLRVGFADQNGHPYRSLGRYLVEKGDLVQGQASMQAIKAWGAAHPDKLKEALNANPSYVFFRELPAPAGPLEGPPGALAVALSPGYSVAVDPRYVPLGAPVFLGTTFPLSTQPLDRLVIAQDTGGAIRGAIRADFFWGTGEEAGNFAGRMSQQGKLWLLWPRGAPLPRQ